MLRVFLKSGPWVDFILPQHESLHLLEEWKVGSTGFLINGKTVDGVEFIAKTEEIALLVVLPWREPQQQSPQQAIPPYGGVRFPGQR